MHGQSSQSHTDLHSGNSRQQQGRYIFNSCDGYYLHHASSLSIQDGATDRLVVTSAVWLPDVHRVDSNQAFCPCQGMVADRG